MPTLPCWGTMAVAIAAIVPPFVNDSDIFIIHTFKTSFTLLFFSTRELLLGLREEKSLVPHSKN